MVQSAEAAVRPIVVLLGSADVGPPHNLAQLDELADIRRCTADGLAEALVGADVLVVWDIFSRALRDHWDAAAPTLRWVHVCAAGVDALLFDELIASEVVVTNAHGAFDRPIAEFVLASILARDKRLHESRRFQDRREWRHRETTLTTGTSALVIGTGGIGREIARLLRAVGIEVAGAGRRARDGDPDFGRVHLTRDLPEYVGDFDAVVAIAPLTAETSGMIDARVLTAMRPGAHLINVGRGQLVDDEALVHALTHGDLGAASLDVFATEPLPADSPLWGMDDVAVSPHMSGDVVGWRATLADQVADNLRRYIDIGGAQAADASSVLANVVDKARGYVVGRDV